MDSIKDAWEHFIGGLRMILPTIFYTTLIVVMVFLLAHSFH